MIFSWQQLFILGIVSVAVESLSTGLLEDVTKADQAMKPKVKRTQEVLMFGNQQNRRMDNAAADTFASNEKRNIFTGTLGSSGLEDVKSVLAQEEARKHFSQNPPMIDRENLSPYDKNYMYGKVMVNEIGDEYPRSWDIMPYSRYYGFDEDRRKRSDKPNGNPLTTSRPTQVTTSPPSSVSSGTPVPFPRSTPRPVSQLKMSAPVYPAFRYKRALDREDLLALLSLWENSPRNRNWHNYGNDEYENIDDDSNIVALDDDDSRANAWLEAPVYTPRHFSLGNDVAASDIGIPRTHPVNSYEQYNSQYGPAYDSTQYGTAQYGSLYPQHSYYQPEKRFMVSRKRSQLFSSQPQSYYPQRIFY